MANGFLENYNFQDEDGVAAAAMALLFSTMRDNKDEKQEPTSTISVEKELDALKKTNDELTKKIHVLKDIESTTMQHLQVELTKAELKIEELEKALKFATERRGIKLR